MNKLLLTVGCIADLSVPSLAGTHKIPKEDPTATITLPDAWEVDEIEDGIEAIGRRKGVILCRGDGRRHGRGSDDRRREVSRKQGVTVDEKSERQTL